MVESLMFTQVYIACASAHTCTPTFKLFSQTKETMGTGLNLPLCRLF